jgi:aryl-alcohol dehydrogenase-like predicted oxidoreductase
MISMQQELAQYGVPLAINQVEFSVLRRLPELSGLLQACKERGIVLQSYSSLGQGRLTGKYTNRRRTAFPATIWRTLSLLTRY